MKITSKLALKHVNKKNKAPRRSLFVLDLSFEPKGEKA